MKHRMTRIFLLMLAALLVLGSVGCSSKETELLLTQINTLTQERYELQGKLDTAQRKLDETEQQLKEANEEADTLRAKLSTDEVKPTPEPVVVKEEVITKVPAEYAFGVDCTVNGSDAVMLDGNTAISCVPKNIEGYVFDHWEVDGVRQDKTEDKLELTVSKTTRIRAVFHERRVVKCINCHFQFLNVYLNARGDDYTEFDFEDDYINPLTNEKQNGGMISFYLFADIPKKKEVDYWMINGVKYTYPNNVTKFRVEELNEATVYEVVFKGQTKKETPQPTAAPRYYNVSCENCRYKYNGSWYTSGKVPAGTQITISGSSDSSEAYFTGSPSSVNRHFTSPTSSSSGKFVFTYTYTVNSDVKVSFRGVVN